MEEGRGEEDRFVKAPLSLTLSPLVPRGEREKQRTPKFLAAHEDSDGWQSRSPAAWTNPVNKFAKYG